VEAVVRDYLMAESAEGNVWLHTADRSLLRPVPLGLVIADLVVVRGSSLMVRAW